MNRIYNKVSLYILAVLTSVSFAACSQEDLDNTSNGEIEMRTVTITASEATMSRTSYEDKDNYLSVNWEVGDVIYVGQANNTKNSDISIDEAGSGFYPFTAKSVNEKEATFTGSLPKTLTGKVLAFYGKKENIKITAENKVKLNFQTQNWNNSKTETNIYSTHLSDYDFMSASTEYDGGDQLSFKFKHEGAVLKLSLSGLPANTPLSTLRLETTDSAKDFNSYVLIGADGTSELATAYNYLSFNIANATTDSEGKVVLYRTVSPTTFNTNSINISLSCSLNKGDYTYSKTLSGITALNAGCFYFTPDITLAEDKTIKGNGSQNTPFIIDNPEKLLEIASQINSGTIPNGGRGKYFEVSRNIDMTGYTWNPIGTSNSFDGILYGKKLNENLVSISGIDYTAETEDINAAFISNSHSSSYIYDLKIVGNFNGKSNYSGGIVAKGYNVKIENCIFEGTVTHNSTITKGTHFVGGIIGFTNLGSCTNCTNLGNIVLSSSGSNANYAAGIAGGIQTGSKTSDIVNIKGCSNNGTIENKKNGNISGIVGNMTSSLGTLNIEDCTLGEKSIPTAETKGSILRYFSYGPADKVGSSIINVFSDGETIATLTAGGGVNQYPNNQSNHQYSVRVCHKKDIPSFFCKYWKKHFSNFELGCSFEVGIQSNHNLPVGNIRKVHTFSCS